MHVQWNKSLQYTLYSPVTMWMNTPWARELVYDIANRQTWRMLCHIRRIYTASLQYGFVHGLASVNTIEMACHKIDSCIFLS